MDKICVGQVNVTTEGTMWGEELPNAFLQILGNWAVGIKQSIMSVIKKKQVADDVVIRQCLDTIRQWDNDLRKHTIMTTLQLPNPQILLLYEYCYLRYLRELSTLGSLNNITPPAFDKFAQVFLETTLDINNDILAIRATMFKFITCSGKQPAKTNVPLLDSLAAEL